MDTRGLDLHGWDNPGVATRLRTEGQQEAVSERAADSPIWRVPPYSFAFDPPPPTDTAQLIERLIEHGVGVETRKHLVDVTVLVVGTAGVAVWGYQGAWHWYTGMANGVLIYDQAPVSNPGATARLIASHLASRNRFQQS